ncbi:MAG: DUF1684 domain-containing protein [Anaerolineales bacterium]|nr:DUF1684 domain-containing protein [Anaerolineales bacterium]
MQTLKTFRVEKDDFFARHHQSPLTSVQKQHFKGLNYFPESTALRLEVDVETSSTLENIMIDTTGGQPQTYQRFGRFKFLVDGQSAELTIYKNQNGYFLPFVDNLAGKETYPAGRYLEPEKLPNGKFLVDFNLAYNPYCAYNEKWSCPITPAENRLKVSVRAGEKIFNH